MSKVIYRTIRHGRRNGLTVVREDTLIKWSREATAAIVARRANPSKLPAIGRRQARRRENRIRRRRALLEEYFTSLFHSVRDLQRVDGYFENETPDTRCESALRVALGDNHEGESDG